MFYFLASPSFSPLGPLSRLFSIRLKDGVDSIRQVAGQSPKPSGIVVVLVLFGRCRNAPIPTMHGFPLPDLPVPQSINPGFSLVQFIKQDNHCTAASQRAGEGGDYQQPEQQHLRANLTLGSGATREREDFRGGLCSFIGQKHEQPQQGPGGVSVEENAKVKMNMRLETFPPEPPPINDGDYVEEDDVEMRTPSYKGGSEEGSEANTPPKGQWKLWDFVKGFTPPRSSLQSLAGLGLLRSWSNNGPGQRSTEHPEVNLQNYKHEKLEVEKKEIRGRKTLPVRVKLKNRPNINKVLWKINKKQQTFKAGAARDALVRDFSANSSRASVASRRSTIARLMNSVTGRSNWLPLQGEDLQSLAAILKEEGYKSAEIYLSDIKLMHIEQGFQWTAQLDRILRQCKLSVNRGKGPRKKAKEVAEDDWAQKEDEDPDLGGLEKKERVRYARRLFALGVQWMMREIEIAALKRDNFEFNTALKTVALTWFESKTDQEGATITRVLQCQCVDGACGLRCPYDNAMQLVRNAFEGGEERRHGFLATTTRGKAASKHMVLKAWQELFGKEISGHSTRRSGALQYIRKGWSISQVAFLGRWRSNIILQYADEALQSIPVNASSNFNLEKKDSAVVRQASIPKDTVIQQEIVMELKEEIRRLKSGSLSVEEKLKKLQDKDTDSVKIDPSLLPCRVASLKSKITHQNVTLLLCTPPHTWRTLCGWHYNNAAYAFKPPEVEVTCQKCINIAQGKEEDKRCG